MFDITPQSTTLKTCPKCGKVKPLDQFAKDSTRVSGVSSYCKECRGQWTKDNAERLRQKARQWQQDNRDRAVATTRAWEQRNPDKVRANADRYPERKKARDAVHYAVRIGKLPPAWTMVCDVCQEAQAASWHHHKGYEPEHWLDTIPLCRVCHGKEHRAYE